MSVEHQKQINKFFTLRPIAYQPGLGQVLGSINAGILLNQLLYWHTKGHRADGFIHKTVNEIYMETALTRSMQQVAIRQLRALELIEYKLAGIPAKRHFKVDFKKLQMLLPSLKQSCNLTYPNPPIVLDDDLQPISKSTQGLPQ